MEVTEAIMTAVEHSRLLTVSEVATILNVNRQRVMEWLWEDAFPNKIRTGENTSTWYIPASDVQAFVTKHAILPSRGMLRAQKMLEQREVTDG